MKLPRKGRSGIASPYSAGVSKVAPKLKRQLFFTTLASLAAFVSAMLRSEHRHNNLSWSDVSKQVIDWMNVDVIGVNWFSTYRVHHRVADRFRAGRAFLLGDAAHIHSPVGAQGMNTSIGDAVNLAWKLAAALRHKANPSILDSYERERIAFARRLVATTDQVFTGVTRAGLIARVIRLRIVPFLLPLLFGFRPVRRLLFRTVSQIAVNYRGSTLNRGRAGKLRGGDRLPWISSADLDSDNFAPLRSLDWQIHIYGNVSPEIQQLCEERQMPLHVFRWRREMSRSGFERDAVYLVRPDGYLAVAARGDDSEQLSAYLEAHQIKSIRVAEKVPA